MPTYVLTIGGITKSLRAGTPDIHEVADGINTMTFEYVSLAGNDRPENGDEVILTEDGITIFGGSIDGPSESYIVPGHAGIVTKCNAVDFNELIDRRILNISLPAGTLEDFLDAIEPYLTDYGVTIDPSQPTGPSLPALSFPFMTLRDAVRQVIDLSNGWLIEITYDKILRGYQSSGEAAPTSITTANRKAIGDIEVTTAPMEANFVYVLGGEGLVAVTDTFTGDGVTTDFDLDHAMAANIGGVTVNGVFETLSEVGGGGTWEHSTAGVTTISRTSAPANGHAISITYTGQFPTLVWADTGPAPADLKEKIYRYPQVFDRDVMQALADELVDRTSVERQTVRYRTAEVGIHPGQTQTITVAARDLSGTFLITDVQIVQNTEAMRLERLVTAVTGTVYPGSPMDDVASWGHGSGSATSSGSITVLTGGGISGSGTAGTIAKFTGTSVLGDSILAESGSFLVAAGTIRSASSSPVIEWQETDAATDQQLWRWMAQGTVLRLQTVNDAYTVATDLVTISRSGAAVFSSTLAATVFSGSGASLTSLPAGQLTGTITSTVQDNITRTGALNSGSITSGFGSIDVGADAISGATVTGTTSVSTPTLTASGNLTLSPTGDIVLDPTGNDILPNTNYDLNLGALNKKYLTLHAAELWVETLVAQNTIATIGGRILVGPTTTLTLDLAAATTTITVKHNQMVSGDRVYMEANGKVEWMAITSAASPVVNGYDYSVTRNLDGSGANDWFAGDAMFNTGTTGKGFIDLYSTSGVLSGSGPTIVGNVRTGTTYNDIAPRWAIGNLNGLYWYGLDTPGVAMGDASGANVVIDATDGFRVRQGTTDYAKMAASVFRIGAAGGNYLQFDGTDIEAEAGNLTIDAAGIRLAPSASAGFASSSGYTWDVGSGTLGLSGYDDTGATDRGLFLQSTYTGSYTQHVRVTSNNGSATGSQMHVETTAANATAELIATANTGGSGDAAVNITATKGVGGGSSAITLSAETITLDGSTRSASGSASVGSGTPTTLFAASATQVGLYLVRAGLGTGSSDATNYGAYAFVAVEGASAKIVATNAPNMTITLSGMNVQATQSSGTTLTIHWVAFKIA